MENNTDILKQYYIGLGIDEKVYDFCADIEKKLKNRFEIIDKIAEQNQVKVIKAMQEAHFAEEHLNGTTGYGYNDAGREAVETIYAKVFKTEDALVRQQITCGTHALTIALSANLRPGDEILSPVGKVYDTLEGVIGIREQKGSLAEYGITYRQVDLLPDGSFDYDNIRKSINEHTKLIEIQRSKGYDVRPTLSVAKIGEVIKFIKESRHDIIQAVEFGKPEFIQAFCEGIQAAAPVDSFVTPVPWDMPGYDSQVIMAAGAFVSGASIELSADAPMKEPYAVYFQGGLTYQHAKFGIMMSLQKIVEKGLLVVV